MPYSHSNPCWRCVALAVALLCLCACEFTPEKRLLREPATMSYCTHREHTDYGVNEASFSVTHSTYTVAYIYSSIP